jgi:DNA-binding transcriptional ArsR family regulator
MQRIHFTNQDLLRSRFLSAPAPLMELVFALVRLRQGGADLFDQWRHATLRTFPRAALPLFDLIYHNYAPDYLDSLKPTFAEGVDEVLTNPPDLVRLPYEDPRYTHEPAPWVHRLADGDHEAQLTLARALHAAHETLVLPDWERMVAGYHADLAHQNRVVAEQGIGAAVTAIFPGGRWNDNVLEYRGKRSGDVYLNGEGVTLIPSVFWLGPPAIGRQFPGQPTLVLYHAQIPLPLLMSSADRDDPDRALAALVGGTRAGVLRVVAAKPAITTSALAAELGTSPGRVSEHASVLRNAGLISSNRYRNRVLHSVTELGAGLLGGSFR